MRKLFIILSFLLLTGCAAANNPILSYQKFEIQNVKQLRTAGQNFLKVWPMYSGLLKGFYGTSLPDELPGRTMQAIVMLDEIARQSQEGKMTDAELGFALGLWGHTSFELIRKFIGQIPVDILRLIPEII